ncbi:MAG TPA: hypothetical protein VH816_10720 [Gaiellaceae bacterium]
MKYPSSARPELSNCRPASFSAFEEVHSVVLLWVLAALLLLFAIVGGVAISKFLFFVLIIAAILALIGFFTRTA